MKKKKFLRGLLITVLHFLICVFAGAIDWQWQTIIVSVAGIFAVFFSYRIISNAFSICLLIIAPFYLLYTIGSISIPSYQTFPIWIMGLLVSLITYLFLRIRLKASLSITVLSALVFLGGMIVWPNTFAYLNSERHPEKYDFAASALVDAEENQVSFNQLKGKVILFDVWHSACYPCIEKFPEIQSLYDDYKSDTSVRIVSLNIPLEKDKGIRPSRFTDNYSFEKIYFLNEEEYKKFSIRSLPLVLIMDKNMKCRYAGQLNPDWNIFIGNTKRIINNLKKEDVQVF